MNEWVRWLALSWRRIRRFLVRANGTPHQIAMGVAVGFFVGWLPIIGIQMAVALIFCSILRCNPVVPLGPIWLTNPVTIVPVYGANYWVGRALVGGPPLSAVAEKFKLLIPHDVTSDFWSNPPLWAYSWVVEFFRNARYTVNQIAALGAEMMVPLWLGSVIVGTVLAVAGYFSTRRLVTTVRDRLTRRRAQKTA